MQRKLKVDTHAHQKASRVFSLFFRVCNLL